MEERVENLEKHVVNLEFSQAGGGGLFIKEPGKKLTKEFIKVFTTPDVTIRPDTVKNISKLWKAYGDSHYAKGTFPPIEEVIKKMGGKFDMSPNSAATATRRISQIMNGTNFIGTNGKYISTNVITDKKAAKNILDKFQLENFSTPYGGANYKINLEIVKDGLPEYAQGQSLNTWKKNAREILKDHGVKFYIKNKQAGFNLNELTGMGSGNINYETGAINMIGCPANAEFVYSVSYNSAFSGKYSDSTATGRINTLVEILANCPSQKKNALVKLEVF